MTDQPRRSHASDTIAFVSTMQKFLNNIVDEERSSDHSSHALLHAHNFLPNVLSNSGQFYFLPPLSLSLSLPPGETPMELEIAILAAPVGMARIVFQIV